MPEAAPTLEHRETVRAMLGGGAGTLAAAGCDTPRLDAELLLGAVLGIDRTRLVLDAARPLDQAAIREFEGLVARRAAREPVAYIVGRRAFRRIELEVDSRVLIPRPETELLVEAALSLPAGARVVDIGTGSGAVALAVKDERPDLSVLGSDVSAGAVALACANAVRLGLDVRFMQADLLAGLPPFDAVLANLPYVAVGAELASEIALYEPAAALFAGDDGLDAIRRLVAQLTEPGAGRSAGARFIALEIGCDQGEAVSGLLLGAGFLRVERVRDLAGHDRVITGRR